jgi:hypothetical protein
MLCYIRLDKVRYGYVRLVEFISVCVTLSQFVRLGQVRLVYVNIWLVQSRSGFVRLVQYFRSGKVKSE